MRSGWRSDEALDWIERYEGLGYRVPAPSCPGFEVEVEALNADPSPIEAVTVPQIIEHLESHVRDLDPVRSSRRHSYWLRSEFSLGDHQGAGLVEPDGARL